MHSYGCEVLKDMIGQPLMNIDKINQRLDAVEEMKNNLFLRKKLSQYLKNIYDLERLISKLPYGEHNT